MGAITHPSIAVPEGIRLAGEPPLKIGELQVDPPTRQVRNGAREETLEPRVMQVLIALARAKGRVVPRDELVELCWEGRAVGEDAIHRVLSRLRQAAAEIGGNSFKIETIRGVGYRLTDQATDRIGGPSLSRRSLVVSTAAAAVAAGAGAWFLTRDRHTPVPLAMQYYQRGLETRGQASIELAEQGAALFREATRIDPQFADAWGALAWNYRGLLEFGPRPDAERLRSLCRSAAAHALALDPDNPDAQAALLLLKPFYRNWAAIEAGCRDLLKRHPHHEILGYNLAFDLAQVGRWNETLPYLRELTARQPFWPLVHLRLILSLYESGNVEEADDLIEDGMKRFPRRKDYWLWKIRHLINAGRFAEAVAFSDDVNSRPAVGIEPAVDFEIGIARALASGSQPMRAAALDTLVTTARARPGYLATSAVSACVLGYVDECLSMLHGYYFGRGQWAGGQSERPVTELLFVGSTSRLRADARFPALLEEIGLEDYWRATGTLPDFRRRR
jgi:DNA-binding winged helix-turn-helix (wHTH) protein